MDLKNSRYELTSSDETLLRENDEYEDGVESARILGTIVHKYLERHPFGNPPDRPLLDTICRRMHASAINGRNLDLNENQALGNKALEQIERTVSDNKLIEILGKGERHSEIPFLFTIPGRIEFRGVIDSLSKKTHSPCWTIIDWKSNELMERNPEDVAKENDYFLQLTCYKWAVERILKEKVERTFIYFTDKGQLLEGREQESPEELIETMLRKIREYDENMDLLKRDAKEIGKTMKGCFSCAFKKFFCKC